MATKGGLGATAYAASKAGVVGKEPSTCATRSKLFRSLDSYLTFGVYMSKALTVLPGFTRALCLEMAARSIRVNALLPGWIESPMWNRMSSASSPFVPEVALKQIPPVRPG